MRVRVPLTDSKKNTHQRKNISNKKRSISPLFLCPVFRISPSHFAFLELVDVVCAVFINYTRAHFANDLQINKHLRFYYCPACVLFVSVFFGAGAGVLRKSLPCGANRRNKIKPNRGFPLKYHFCIQSTSSRKSVFVPINISGSALICVC